MLFLENEAQIDQNNYGMMLSMSKQVSLPKFSSILQKMKIGQNSIYALFARSPSIRAELWNSTETNFKCPLTPQIFFADVNFLFFLIITSKKLLLCHADLDTSFVTLKRGHRNLKSHIPLQCFQ